jgi:Uma2 family endonuclease
MGESCILADDDHVELLEGLIVTKMIRKPVHDAVVEMVRDAIGCVLPAGWCIRSQSAITTADSEPEPDIAVVRGTARDYLGHHPGPTEIALVVEVAETSLDRDRYKRRLYARAGLACYWIINLQAREVEVYTNASSAEVPKYEEEIVHEAMSSIPFVIAGQQIAQIPASDLLP